VPGVYSRGNRRPGRLSTTGFRKWGIDGTWERLNAVVRERLRVSVQVGTPQA
jgi:transposase